MSSEEKKHRFTTIVATLALLAAACPPAAWGQQKAKPAPKDGKGPQLVWPLPPEKPRLRFVEEIHGTSDIEPQAKRSMLERISGIQKREFKPTFAKPYGIATDSKHRIFVTDNGQAMVFVIDREHHQVSYIGLDGNPRLRTPMGITVDAQDRIWLADGGAQRIYAFDPQLTLRAAIGKPGELMNPVGLATDATRNRLYVADSKQHCVVVYDTETAQLLAKFGKRGSGNGEFNFPTDVAVAADGRVYVADTLNRRIQVFDPSYKFVEKFGSEGVSWGQFRKPKSLALDSFQNVYVLDSDFSNFQVFDQKRRLLMFLGEFGGAPGQFAVPQQIRIDADNLIYVVDQMNGRIQVLKILSGDVEEPARAAGDAPPR